MDACGGVTELVERLNQVLGSRHVIAEPGTLEPLTRTCIPYRQMPAIAVFPGSADEVRRVMALAAEFAVPVWPVSTGKNWGYGERGACYPGGITMVLSRMDRILQVDETLGYAVIEPGVTYGQLNAHLKATGSRLWTDCTGSTPDASVIGNALDKGRGLTPYADHFGCLSGMDVVLADGSLLETGGGPQGGSHVRHVYKWGVGPYLDGLFAQSNLGIVVKSGVWLMPAPECFDFAGFEYTAEQSRFGEFLDAFRELVFAGAIRSHPHLANDFAMMCILEQYPHERLQGERRLSEPALQGWRKQHGVASWTFGCGLYGSREEIRFQKRAIKQSLGRFGLIRFVGAAARDDWRGRLVRWGAPLLNRLLGKSDGLAQAMLPAINLFRGIPTEHFARQAYFKSHHRKPAGDIDPPRDGCGLLWVGPVVPFTSAHIQKAMTLSQGIFQAHGFDFFLEIVVESARSVLFLVGVFYERQDPGECERATRWYHALRDAFITAGYPPYRATSISMAGAMDANPPAKALLGRVKAALDPQGLIAPGRYGIAGESAAP